jgi:5-(carboxyamino)imidazole ribonucleotide synthase
VSVGQASDVPGAADRRAQTLGVLGGGQLGRMLVHEAQRMGFRVVVLDPDADCPAGRAADELLCAAYDDPSALRRMAETCAAVTTEFENVPATSLRILAAHCAVSPQADAVAICQHRALEKAHFVRSGVPCAPHLAIEHEGDLARVSPGLLPGILKTSQLGYDGKGQARVSTAAELAQAWRAMGQVPCLLEALVPIQFEVSVIVARNAAGDGVHLPVQQNLHRDGILAVTRVPAPDASADVAQRAVAMAHALADGFDYVGVLCVEFFVLADGQVLANEMAPRPHNSGHYSLDACDVSQFELQLRAAVGWPLTQPRLHSPAVMLNLLGDLWFTGSPGAGSTADADAGADAGADLDRTAVATSPDWPALLALPGAHLHLYGKAQARRARKMGHLTITAGDADAAQAAATQAAVILGLPRP